MFQMVKNMYTEKMTPPTKKKVKLMLCVFVGLQWKRGESSLPNVLNTAPHLCAPAYPIQPNKGDREKPRSQGTSLR